MGVHEGRGQLNQAMKDLMRRWADTKSSWNDAVSHRFEKQHLIPLEMSLRNAMGALDSMAQTLQQIRRDCE